jgi:c-di-GMP-binding flagellar brake protein YcgR
MDTLPYRKLASKNSRELRRFRSFCLLKYSVLNRMPQKTTMVNPKDINAKGTLFVSDEYIPLNSLLELDLYLPPLKDFITIMAKVARVQKARDDDRYFVGTQFTAMDPADKLRIHSYIEKQAKDPDMQRYFDKRAGYFKRSLL